MINEVNLYAMRRELNEIEYLNWCFGQPYNIVISVRIRGNIPPDRLQSALDKAQQRHPLLKVNTILDEMRADGTLKGFSEKWFDGLDLTVEPGS